MQRANASMNEVRVSNEHSFRVPAIDLRLSVVNRPGFDDPERRTLEDFAF